VKFTESGDISVSVDVLDDAKEKVTLRFSVRDTGIGIPPDQTDHIFERFTQVDGSSTREYGGTGLGLAICSGLVELLGGGIGVESELGKGSNFWFTVPLEKQYRVKRDASTPKPPIPTQLADRGLRVLLAEDDVINYNVAKMILEQLGCFVDWAKNGLEATRMYGENEYDFVFMDIQMPTMKGVKTTRLIRRQEQKTGQRTPIVALTAHAMKGDRDRCLQAGLDGYIIKPVVFDDLRDALTEYVQEQPVHLS